MQANNSLYYSIFKYNTFKILQRIILLLLFYRFVFLPVTNTKAIRSRVGDRYRLLIQLSGENIVFVSEGL